MELRVQRRTTIMTSEWDLVSSVKNAILIPSWIQMVKVSQILNKTLNKVLSIKEI
jgi:hypothetical protein